MIELDGSYLEGGGALVRNALALSALTGKEFQVNKIRSGRERGGLKAQHLTAIKALKEVCQAETNEVEIGSTELYFKPGKIKSGTYEIDIGTAGSISLLLQALILPCLFAPSKVTLKIKGGTCGQGQASVDYLQNVLLPHLQKFAQKIELKVLKRGYYPKGGGEVEFSVSPKYKLKDYADFPSFAEELSLHIPKIKLTERKELQQIRGIVNVSAELAEKEVGERIKNSAEAILKKYPAPGNIRIDYVKSLSIGGEVNLWAIFSNKNIDQNNPQMVGEDALIEKDKTSEQVGKEVAEKLVNEIDAGYPVDRWLADQLISFMALLPGSEIRVREISKHTQTNIYVAEKFLAVEFKNEGNNISVEKK